jgi:hypothetical protein
MLKFSGIVVPGTGANYLADQSAASGAALLTPTLTPHFPVGLGFTISTLAACLPQGNPNPFAVTLALLKNGIPVPGAFVIFNAGDGPATVAQAVFAPVAYLPGDTYDLVTSTNASSGPEVGITASIGGP